MRLLPLTHFASIFQPLIGKRVGFVEGIGNAGDHLIDAATRQLLNAFQINWIPFNIADPTQGVELILLFGGGNMGSGYFQSIQRRDEMLATGLPCIVLPQSFVSPENKPFQLVYVRERASLQFCPRGILAPDLALGYDDAYHGDPADEPFGLFLRDDSERALAHCQNRGDPASMCDSHLDYLNLAGRFEAIATDRLHFAICGLIRKRQVTLLPNAYHKNRSMWETWLHDLGCHWANDLQSIVEI